MHQVGEEVQRVHLLEIKNLTSFSTHKQKKKGAYLVLLLSLINNQLACISMLSIQSWKCSKVESIRTRRNATLLVRHHVILFSAVREKNEKAGHNTCSNLQEKYFVGN